MIYPEGPGRAQTLVSDLLLFHHVPKTAGTSLISILRRDYAPDEFLALYGPDAWSDARALAANGVPAGVRCVATHTTEVLVAGLGDSFRACSLLRDPVERVVSMFHFILSIADRNPHRGGRLGRAVKALGWSIGDIYRNLAGGSEASSDRHRLFSVFFNGQTRHLLGPYHSTGGMPFAEGCPPALSPYAARAEAELDRRYVLGTIEQFPRSVELFARRFGWSCLGHPRERVSDRPPSERLPAEQRSLILRYNALDAELHGRVSARVQARNQGG
jgi:hypothetical protein